MRSVVTGVRAVPLTLSSLPTTSTPSEGLGSSLVHVVQHDGNGSSTAVLGRRGTTMLLPHKRATRDVSSVVDTFCSKNRRASIFTLLSMLRNIYETDELEPWPEGTRNERPFVREERCDRGRFDRQDLQTHPEGHRDCSCLSCHETGVIPLTANHIAQIWGRAAIIVTDRGFPILHERRIVLLHTINIWSAEDRGPVPNEPQHYHISFPLPTYARGRHTSLPPTFSAGVSNAELEVKYSINIDMIRKGFHRHECESTVFYYLPRSIPTSLRSLTATFEEVEAKSGLDDESVEWQMSDAIAAAKQGCRTQNDTIVQVCELSVALGNLQLIRLFPSSGCPSHLVTQPANQFPSVSP